MFAAIAGSYLLVALLGFALGRIHAELQIREAHSWPTLPDTDCWLPTAAAYDWAEDDSYFPSQRHPTRGDR